MNDEPNDFLDAIEALESAEDFLDYFKIPFEPDIVHVNRLHILQRYHNYLQAHRERDGEPGYDDYQALLTQAYADFVRSDAYTEKVIGQFDQAGERLMPSRP
jgi:nitrogenase-stabilizing/protective protein